MFTLHCLVYLVVCNFIPDKLNLRVPVLVRPLILNQILLCGQLLKRLHRAYGAISVYVAHIMRILKLRLCLLLLQRLHYRLCQSRFPQL